MHADRRTYEQGHGNHLVLRDTRTGGETIQYGARYVMNPEQIDSSNKRNDKYGVAHAAEDRAAAWPHGTAPWGDIPPMEALLEARVTNSHDIVSLPAVSAEDIAHRHDPHTEGVHTIHAYQAATPTSVSHHDPRLAVVTDETKTTRAQFQAFLVRSGECARFNTWCCGQTTTVKMTCGGAGECSVSFSSVRTFEYTVDNGEFVDASAKYWAVPVTVCNTDESGSNGVVFVTTF